jgi:hypothetical protein
MTIRLVWNITSDIFLLKNVPEHPKFGRRGVVLVIPLAGKKVSKRLSGWSFCEITFGTVFQCVPSKYNHIHVIQLCLSHRNDSSMKLIPSGDANNATLS